MRRGLLEAMTCGPRTSLPRESSGGSHCLAYRRIRPGGLIFRRTLAAHGQTRGACAHSLRPKPQQLQARHIPMRPVHLPSRSLVRDAIAASLPDGGASLRRTAQVLGVSTRSLQRHLADTGTSYSELVADVRLDVACRLLAGTEKRMSDIALLLGYTGPSSFSRSFMRLMKMQPVAYRREHRNGCLAGVASGPSRLARNGKTPRRHWRKRPNEISAGEREK